MIDDNRYPTDDEVRTALAEVSNMIYGTIGSHRVVLQQLSLDVKPEYYVKVDILNTDGSHWGWIFTNPCT